ncbi:MAG: MBL fold metallo-hydrolase [SAR324 cluster bacterium]|nr:MBL fold metallo-hydrolase [SAR324 cluster bacterium]
MTANRQEGQINPHTYLIDAVHDDIQGAYAAYLLKSREGKTCLIDAGTKDSVTIIYQRLQQWNAWPLDMIILTHSHWDHTQGVEFLQERAQKMGHHIDVMASEKAIPYLEDQSYNTCFNPDQAPFLNIPGVTGLKNGDQIELGPDLRLRIIDTPGHMPDHISILDETNKNLFTGNAIGMKWADAFIVPNPNSTFWQEKQFYNSIETIKTLDLESICLGHFGCLQGDEARTFPDETLEMYKQWMAVFKRNQHKLDDIPYLIKTLIVEVYDHVPEEYHELVAISLTEAVGFAAGVYRG